MSGLFYRPDLWPLLLAAPLLALVFWGLDRARARRLIRAIGPRRKPLAAGWSPSRRSARRRLFFTALLLASVAAMRPVWGETMREVKQRGVDLVVCLDVSRSMRARDAEPDRLERARAEIRALARHAVRDRLALVAFAGEARLVVPLTRDHASFVTLLDLVDPLSVSRGGTDLGAALTLALESLGDATGEHEAILLLTDGEDHGGAGRRVAEGCRERGVSVHAVGFGSKLGAKIPVAGEGGESFLRDADGNEVVSALAPETLRAIAHTTGGAYVDGLTTPLVALYDAQVAPMARKLHARQTRPLRQSRFQWPLLLAFLLWVFELGIRR